MVKEEESTIISAQSSNSDEKPQARVSSLSPIEGTTVEIEKANNQQRLVETGLKQEMKRPIQSYPLRPPHHRLESPQFDPNWIFPGVCSMCINPNLNMFYQACPRPTPFTELL